MKRKKKTECNKKYISLWSQNDKDFLQKLFFVDCVDGINNTASSFSVIYYS